MTDRQHALVGPYRLCVELGSGGMATVYLGVGETASAGRFAAVKVLHPHLANSPGFLEMFVDEAEIASRIRHTNVCTVYDLDVTDRDSYIAMEYLVGEPLSALHRKLSRRGDPDVERSSRMLAKALGDACEGLHAAHELRDDDGVPLEVVHRDVSPSNVVLTFDGVAKVVDFGVAAATRKRHQTETGFMKGKIAYLAPECIDGQRPDRRADVWGMGVVAWEMLTGERLFRRDTDVATLRAVMDEEIVPPSSVRPELPEDLDAVVMLALERDPSHRYQTARELGRELARFALQRELVTTSDVGEWLRELFPSAKVRKEQLLEVAAQIGAERDGPMAPPVGRPRLEPAVDASFSRSAQRGRGAREAKITEELEATHVYDSEPPPRPIHPPRRSGLPEGRRPVPPPPPRAATSPRWLAAGALAVGVLLGGAGLRLVDSSSSASAARSPSAPAAEDTSLRAADPPEPPAEPASPLRLGPGASIESGPYVMEVVPGAEDQMVLRIRPNRQAHQPRAASEGGHDELPTEQPPPIPPAATDGE